MGEMQGGIDPSDQTRARAGGREADLPRRRGRRPGDRNTDRPVVERVWIGEGRRRTPLVLVQVNIHRLRLTFGVALLRTGRMELRPPLGPDRMTDGLRMTPAAQAMVAEVVFAAVKADPAVRALRW